MRAKIIFLCIAIAILLAFLAYAWLVIKLSGRQEELIFPGPNYDLDYIKAEGLNSAQSNAGDLTASHPVIEELHLEVAEGVHLYGWRWTASPIDGQAPRALLYFHGNASSVLGPDARHRDLAQSGWDVYCFHYRGYPGSAGQPSEVALESDAAAIWRYLLDDQGFSPDRIVIHGRSLGGAVAIPLAARERPAGLIIESTFTSLEEIVRSRMPWVPVRSVLKHPFRSRDLAPKLDMPVLVLHGALDTTIPISHGRAWVGLLPHATVVTIDDAGHNDMQEQVELIEAVEDFLMTQVP